LGWQPNSSSPSPFSAEAHIGPAHLALPYLLPQAGRQLPGSAMAARCHRPTAASLDERRRPPGRGDKIPGDLPSLPSSFPTPSLPASLPHARPRPWHRPPPRLVVPGRPVLLRVSLKLRHPAIYFLAEGIEPECLESSQTSPFSPQTTELRRLRFATVCPSPTNPTTPATLRIWS
jgi:hypothetical protein